MNLPEKSTYLNESVPVNSGYRVFATRTGNNAVVLDSTNVSTGTSGRIILSVEDIAASPAEEARFRSCRIYRQNGTDSEGKPVCQYADVKILMTDPVWQDVA